MEGWSGEALRLREEVIKLKTDMKVQKGLADMYNEGFEEVASLLQNRQVEYETLAVKYEEKSQRVMNWIADHQPLAPQMHGWNHLWPDSDAEIEDDPEEDPEDMPMENQEGEDGVEDQDGAGEGIGDGAIVDADPPVDE